MLFLKVNAAALPMKPRQSSDEVVGKSLMSGTCNAARAHQRGGVLTACDSLSKLCVLASLLVRNAVRNDQRSEGPRWR